MSTKSELEVGGTKVAVSNLDKVLYPKAGFTKGDLINYYVRISDVLLPHLKDRPITLKRYPDGAEGFFFYEKQCPANRPRSMKTAKVPKSDGGEVNYCVALEGEPRFDGHAPGWVVMPPGSGHVPTVSGGRMLIVYLLPKGQIEFTKT